MDASRRGDRSAFERLVRRHGGAALGLATALVGDRGRAEDVAQEAFLKAYARLGQLRESERFGPWLLGIVRGAALDALRREKRRPTVWREELADQTAAPPEEPGQALEMAERQARIRAAIAALPEHYREVVALKYEQDRSYEEIAALLETTKQTVESRLFRARQALRQELGSLLDEGA